jgi:thiosulfate reductase cytochrome b subunit
MSTETRASGPSTAPPAPPADPAFRPRGPGEAIYRHKLVTRVTHWINVFCISLLLMSGLQIFNAHPHLYWGQYGADADKAFIELVAETGARGEAIGVTRIGPLTVKTTGLFGLSGPAAAPEARGFPSWATLPSYRDLGTGRRWHFFLAWLFVVNGLVYLGYGAASGHFKRDIALTREEIRPRHIVQDIWDHVRLKHPTGEAAKRYNSLQKMAYLAVIFLFLPLMVLTGLTMSPGVDAALPVLLDIFGGRQSARTIHFLAASGVVAFVVVHVFEVFIAGVWNELRSMITGWYVVKPEAHNDDA